MTRDKALAISDLIFKIERYEALKDEIKALSGLTELYEVFDETELEEQLIAVVQHKIDTMLKELEAM